MSMFDNLFKKFLGSAGFSAGENYIENKNTALRIISTHMSRHTDSGVKDLEVLELYIVTSDSDAMVNWGDTQFVNELKTQLHQDKVTAVKEIRIHTLSQEQVGQVKDELKVMVENRLYYKTHSNNTPGKLPAVAWLVYIGTDPQAVKESYYELNPSVKKRWNIGRTERPDVIYYNDIVINEECSSISRKHAAIVVDSGHYYVKCEPGGCRTQGGNGMTKIHRANGQVDELQTLSAHATGHLCNGDSIQISRTVYFKFVTDKPSFDA